MFRVSCFNLVLGLISAAGFAQSATNLPTAPAASASSKTQENPISSSVSGTSAATTAIVTSSAPASTAPPEPMMANPIGEATVLYRKGKFDGAIAKYQEFLKYHPKSPDAFAGEVRVYLKQKNVDQAAEVVEQALAQSNSPRMRVAQAEVWFRQGKINEAEKQWVDVINSGYPEARAYLGLARVRDALAMYKSAKKMIDKAHELDPLDPDIQEEWIGTLSRSEHIQYLETSLAGDNNWDTDQRADVASYLRYLKAPAKQKNESCHLVSKVTQTETPLVRLLIDPTHVRGYAVSVVLNGHKNSLMLDTGASGILVKRSIAEHAGISKISETKVLGSKVKTKIPTMRPRPVTAQNQLTRKPP